MIPGAAVAAIRAAVEEAQRNDLRRPEAVTEQVVEELAAQGWTITKEPEGPQLTAA
ncbi:MULTISPECIES: hypothetical protein [unclassified Streptomyces]|uniref:Uncharacterized protein n=1 Tax=Streptomyces sp. NBC_00060 TaxID=2975636 RepID=A0AAU2H3D8_9ACTN